MSGFAKGDVNLLWARVCFVLSKWGADSLLDLSNYDSNSRRRKQIKTLAREFFDSADQETDLSSEFVTGSDIMEQVNPDIFIERKAATEIADEVLSIVQWEMEHAAPELPLPVLADGATGKRWGEAH